MLASFCFNTEAQQWERSVVIVPESPLVGAFRSLLLLTLALLSLSAHASPDIARVYKVKQDLVAMEAALGSFHHDVGRYPTSEEGLVVLVEPTPELKATGTYARDGYLVRLPRDPWGYDYHYIAPGSRSGQGYDLWSDGADGKPGGVGLNADVGNWPGSVDSYLDHVQRSHVLRLLAFGVGFGAVAGVVLGLPIFAVGVVYRRKRGGSVQALVRLSFIQFPLIGAACMLLMSFVLDHIMD